MGYDALGRLTSKDLPGSEPDVAYGYDLMGQMTSVSSSSQSLSFAFDALGRNLSQTDGSRTYSSTYDLAGRRTRITHPDGFFVQQDYLVTGEMTTIRERDGTTDDPVTSGVGVLATYGYDDLGRRSSLTYGNGESASYSYDAVSRLSQLSYDLGGSATTNDLTLTFAYNPASQIVSRIATNNLYAWTGHGSDTTSATANGLNQIGSWNGTLTWDAKGNMTSDGTRSYSYDSENRLSLPGTTTPYHYDPLGRLAGAGSPLIVQYDNYVDGLIAEKAPSSSNVTYRHVFGPGTDEPIVWYSGSGTSDRRFLHADERGSIVAVTGSSANLLAINRYDEYGKTQTSNSTYMGRFLYTGQRYFAASGLYYYKTRFYHPSAGARFMQTDPIGYGGGMNLYAYVGGDPINATDPAGTEICTGSHINTPGECSGGLAPGLNGFSTAGTGGGASGGGGGKDTANDPGKGDFKNVGIEVKDIFNSFNKSDSINVQMFGLNISSPYNSTSAVLGIIGEVLGDIFFPPQAGPDKDGIGGAVLERGTQVSGRFPKTADPADIYYRLNNGKITSYMVYGVDSLPTLRVDLTGKPHGGISTPHAVDYVRNYGPNGQVRLQLRTREATWWELPPSGSY